MVAQLSMVFLDVQNRNIFRHSQSPNTARGRWAGAVRDLQRRHGPLSFLIRKKTELISFYSVSSLWKRRVAKQHTFVWWNVELQCVNHSIENTIESDKSRSPNTNQNVLLFVYIGEHLLSFRLRCHSRCSISLMSLDNTMKSIVWRCCYGRLERNATVAVCRNQQQPPFFSFSHFETKKTTQLTINIAQSNRWKCSNAIYKCLMCAVCVCVCKWRVG